MKPYTVTIRNLSTNAKYAKVLTLTDSAMRQLVGSFITLEGQNYIVLSVKTC